MSKSHENNLKLNFRSLNKEIRKGNSILSNKDITIFNSSVLLLKNTKKYLVASRGWYGDVRSWDGLNFLILTVMDSKYKKISQNILDIDEKILKDKTLEFKKFKDKIVLHQDTMLEGPEDPRLFYYNGDVHILMNQMNESEKKDNKKTNKKRRLMHIATIDLESLNYKTPKTLLCESLSTSFEKNWGPFTYQNKLHMLYDINPLTIMEVDPQYKCKTIVKKYDSVLTNIENSFGKFDFHLRNSTNLIEYEGGYLGLGHAVLDYKKYTELNNFFLPEIEKSDYSKRDKEYFMEYPKLYLGFFFYLDMKKKEITKLGPFFQLPGQGCQQDLIFFPVSMYQDNDKFLNISYNLADNSSYKGKIHLDVVKTSLYDKQNIDMHSNFNLNRNYYLELLRTLRTVNNVPSRKNKKKTAKHTRRDKKKKRNKTRRH